MKNIKLGIICCLSTSISVAQQNTQEKSIQAAPIAKNHTVIYSKKLNKAVKQTGDGSILVLDTIVVRPEINSHQTQAKQTVKLAMAEVKKNK